MKLEFDVIKVKTPLKYPIGDRGLSINDCDFAALSIHDRESGKTGWGYGICMTRGYFKNTGWWIQPMPSEEEIRKTLHLSLPELWKDQGPESLTRFGDDLPLELTWLRRGIDMALRDLQAKINGKSVYQMLGGTAPYPLVPAYGSLLDFPLTDAQALEKLQWFLDNGFHWIKVKIGSPHLQRDISRLKLIQHHAGPGVKITADANQAWDLEGTIQAMKKIEAEGIHLEYIEDPMPLTLIKDFPELKRRSPFKVAAHDYIQKFEELESLMLSGGVDYVRSSSSVSIHQRLAPLAVKQGIGIIYGNSNMESNIHSAAALPGTFIVEYSHLDYNELLKEQICVEKGFLLLPKGEGFGLDPNPEMLKKRHQPLASDFINNPCPWKE